jgi:outer membrane murein-binding lipoprotein Lpp
MRIVKLALAASASSLLLAGCASGGLAGRNAPDEYAVARNAPLVVPAGFRVDSAAAW